MAKKPKTARAVHANKGVEVAYRKRLDKLISEMSNSVEYWLEAAYKAYPPRMEVAMDALPSSELSKRIKELSKRWISRFDEMSEKIADDFTRQGAKHTDSAFKQSLKDAGWTIEFKVTPVMRDAINATIQENVALIKSIPQQYMLEVEGIVMRGFTAGRDLSYISSELQARYGITKRRAALISRDQANKLTATVTQARRIELGITKAVWVHSGASKHPRASHLKAGKDKQVFDVDKGLFLDGEWVLPGQAINCRCSSKSVLPF
jgi:uncharacterized protein with gpF-like domain